MPSGLSAQMLRPMPSRENPSAASPPPVSVLPIDSMGSAFPWPESECTPMQQGTAPSATFAPLTSARGAPPTDSCYGAVMHPFPADQWQAPSRQSFQHPHTAPLALTTQARAAPPMRNGSANSSALNITPARCGTLPASVHRPPARTTCSNAGFVVPVTRENCNPNTQGITGFRSLKLPGRSSSFEAIAPTLIPASCGFANGVPRSYSSPNGGSCLQTAQNSLAAQNSPSWAFNTPHLAAPSFFVFSSN